MFEKNWIEDEWTTEEKRIFNHSKFEFEKNTVNLISILNDTDKDRCVEKKEVQSKEKLYFPASFPSS